MRTTLSEMSFEDVTYWIHYALDNPDEFLSKITYYARNVSFAHLLTKMLDVVTAAYNQQEYNDAPGEGEVNDILYTFALLPFLLLQDETEHTWNIILAIVLLTHNYTILYPNEKLQQVIEATFTIFQTYNHMTLLIGACDNLLTRCERWENSQVDLYGICDAFKERLLYAENHKEDNNASSSNS